jgi:hypothetical protein
MHHPNPLPREKIKCKNRLRKDLTHAPDICLLFKVKGLTLALKQMNTSVNCKQCRLLKEILGGSS